MANWYLFIVSKKKRGMKTFFCMQINIKLTYRLILLVVVGTGKPAPVTQNSKIAKSVIFKKVGDEVEILYIWASKFSINCCYQFWWAWPGMPKVLKIISMQYLCNISRKNCVTKLMFCMLINMKLFYKLILLFLIGLAPDMLKAPGQV